MQAEIVMPKMGESIQEGKVLRWMKKVGDKIQKDETILEISTDKVDSEIPSPVGGILVKILVKEQETVPVGTVIALVESDVNSRVDTSTTVQLSAPAATHERPAGAAVPAIVVSVAAGGKDERNAKRGGRFYSPLVRSIAQKEQIPEQELDRIDGTGANGRVTKHDILEYLNRRGVTGVPSAGRGDAGTAKIDMADLARKYPPPNYRVAAMDNVQRRMAEHMVRSVATSPHVAAIDEVDVTAIVAFRSREAERFEKQEGFKLTYTPFFADAVVCALKEFPIVNASVEGDAIIYKTSINLGIAVASPTGLLVPVIRNAGERSFLVIARAINDIAVRTRSKKLMPDEVLGGTFSITNYGVFGNIIGIPIINQPQVAILGVGAIKKRPMVLTDEAGNDAIAVRSMTYLTLSFDHRIIDGSIGGQFLGRIRWYLEHFDFSKVA